MNLRRSFGDASCGIITESLALLQSPLYLRHGSRSPECTGNLGLDSYGPGVAAISPEPAQHPSVQSMSGSWLLRDLCQGQDRLSLHVSGHCGPHLRDGDKQLYAFHLCYRLLLCR